MFEVFWIYFKELNCVWDALIYKIKIILQWFYLKLRVVKNLHQILPRLFKKI